MISLLDFIGAITSVFALLFLVSYKGKQLPFEERWILIAICVLTAIVNGLSVVIWIGIPNGPELAETWTDFIQILQPVMWGLLFFTVVQLGQQRELLSSQEKMRALVENMPVILHAYDRDGKLLAWNRYAEEVMGLDKNDIFEKNDAILKLFVDPEVRDQLMQECASFGGDFRHRIRTMQCGDGNREIAWYNISRRFPISSWANWCIGLDMTDQLRAQRQLEHLATHDELTRLPNRTLLRSRLERALADCDRNGAVGALLMIDLDHFKMINDSFGHPAGDELLRQVSNRMRECLKSTDTLSRFSGDEFVILLENIYKTQNAVNVANRVINELCRQPFDIFNNQIRVQCSIGITVFPEDDSRIDELMKNMDLALYAAKEQGRNNYHLYSRSMHQKLRRQHEIAEKLREAIDRNELELYYQPQINAAGSLVGVEALIRWPGYDQGRVSPAIFIPIAEATGMMPLVGQWVVRQAFLQTLEWQSLGHNFYTAINLSPLQLYQSNIKEVLLSELEKVNLAPECIELEITESTAMRNLDSAIDIMRSLRNIGFNIALDDFGTGYSSLSNLKRFPINTMKIDRSFIKDIVTNEIDKSIVHNVIQMAHSLNFKTVAEGVETKEQQQLLLNEGCDILQGYLFARPMPAIDISKFIDAQTIQYKYN